MKIGLVGYQGCGKSTLFELLTGISPDPSKAFTGQVGTTDVPDERFDKLIELYQPKKISPARIELFDTPGLSRSNSEANAQKLAVIRESAVLVHIVGCFSGADPLADARAFEDDLVLADLQVVSNRVARLEKDAKKPRPDRDELQAEFEALKPIEEKLNNGESLQEMEFNEPQEKACKSFALLTRKRQFLLLNTSDSGVDADVVSQLEMRGFCVVSAPIGLELEVQALPEEERVEFSAEMGLGESCARRVLRAIFEITDLITFYTCNEKEVHAWLLRQGASALEAADSIHSDLARGFIRVEVQSVDDLLRLGSEREVKAAGLHHVEGKEYLIQNGDEIVVRFNV
jgi:GTP-binding protein YchF